ncbi:NAD(P)H pyrophosphatase NUDT13, mitochondrial [Hemicordylus capensis]|uniref:NAD(P)H pyrophosphatase NUDT13, mitochondrial n=1 Tax=Hemicordylus capensis TaxID=884348 RepID=UPI00230367B3|nr:NAD(P)H pyrophosphatase NUDT13, mitochondrial [Hemicordylus capensis]XP_053162161.1 NAD(P)H pyrophosphatase NUDT13, mitochondrial [Hemicordylus capensis]XP_053162162.1 NAD(P)H pyrophosphatase NUDT13, mitochondrial [Hemicordylus capensis]XP_053162163.1 NAD(P)H pyrophosphatase NUDT13, mitochondrial [Hemicordylus capensis]XP_053162164.1 NAD(P)H pyrophosphatase NUDT13, mitochondrial [Hemicordylus capensis]XP_053162165.1 NAD(P)H pyrophosphatase NUDT13, mitochondrial [Hemicordylus capensis]
MVIALVCQAGYRSIPSLCYRLHSTYVRRMRYLFQLKEDDEACRQAYHAGTFFLFYNNLPFLQQEGKMFLAPKINGAEIKKILEQFRQSEEKIEDSLLIGCSYECTPYFALDLGSLERAAIESELNGSFVDLWKAFFQLREEDASLISTAQALLHWHDNHQYCGKTGQPTRKNLAGSKRVCQGSGLICYPQMSPVVITLVSDGSQCLLVRQASFPQGMYSALAGFCDVGESLEETVRREVAEEVGLEVESLWYSASQHWAFPNSSLMIACHALVNPQKNKISIDRQEIEAAKWFSHEEVVMALGRKPQSSIEKDDGSSFWVPPKQAIAHQLIQEWVKKHAAVPA